MSVEDDLFSTLKSLVGNRVAPSFPQPPKTPTWPAIRYQIISNVPVIDIEGDGDDSTSEQRIQLDVVASTYDAARAIRLQVMAAMKSFDPPVNLSNSNSTTDAETKTSREILQYITYGSSDDGNSP